MHLQTPGKILFVDDERNVLRALQRSFIDDDYEILTAESGPEALELLNRERPVQMVVSDYRMPGMSGVELLRTVSTRWPETIRIVLSGFADAPAVVPAINEGKIFRFIPKPWDEAELKATVRDGFDQLRNLRAIENLQATVEQLEEENTALLTKSQEVATRLAIKDRAFSQAADILNALPVGIVGIDGQGRVVFCNQTSEAVLQTTATGIRWEELFADAQREAIMHALAESGHYAGELSYQDRSVQVEGHYLRPTTRQGILLILKGGIYV